MIESIQKLPMWSVIVICISVLIVVAGILTPHFFDSFFSSSVGSFVSNIIAEVVGILVGALFVYYVVNSYIERKRFSKMIEQRDPFLESLETGLHLSLHALCSVLGCPFIDKQQPPSNLHVMDGKEEQIRTWFNEVKGGDPLPPIDVKAIVECLQYILNYSLKSPLDEIRAVSYLFEDDPKIIREVSGVAHSVHSGIVFFSHPNVEVVTYEGQQLLGGIGELLIDLLVKSRLAKKEKTS